MKKKLRSGFTLIELVISMIILAVAAYSLIAVFVTAGTKGLKVEIFSVAQSLAEGKLEQILGQSFKVVTSEAQTSYSGDLSAYSYVVTSSYASAEVLDATAVGTTSYKRVNVSISHPKLSNPVQLETIKANY